MIPRSLFTSVFLSVACLEPALADIAHLQNFGNATDKPTSISKVGWKSLVSTNKNSDVSKGAGDFLYVAPQVGNPIDLANVGVGPSTSNERGLLSLRNEKDTFYTALIYTDESPLERSKIVPVSIQWNSAGTKGARQRTAIRIGEQWYVSREKRASILALDSEEFKTKAGNTRSFLEYDEWFPLLAKEGSPFIIAGKAVEKLPDGPMTAYGVFAVPAKEPDAHLNLDSYLIRALPVSAGEAATAKSSYNVRELGAKGDGKTDDSAAFQKGLDLLSVNGGVLYVPTGDYRIARTLSFSAYRKGNYSNYVRITGDGASSKLIGDGVEYILAGSKETNGSGFRYTDGHSEPEYWNGLRVDRLFFTSMDDADGKRVGGIDASYLNRWECSNSFFERLNIAIYQMGTDVYPGQCTWIIRIRNNTFQGCEYAMKFGHIFDMSVEGNIIEVCGGGLAVGMPGDKLNASANTLRIFNNIFEAIRKHPAILGACWVGYTIQGNYFEGNRAGDIEIRPESTDGGLRGGAIIGNTFQPFKKDPRHGPILLKRASATVIAGNFSTGPRMLDAASTILGGVNLVSNAVNNSRAMYDIDGDLGPDQAGGNSVQSYQMEEKWEVMGVGARVRMDPNMGFQFQRENGAARSIRYGAAPPVESLQQHQGGDLIFNEAPTLQDGKRVVLGWICVEPGKPGVWKPLYATTD